MTSVRWMAIAALAAAGLAGAPAAFAKTSTAKGKVICKEAVQTASPGAEKVRVDQRDIRSTDTTLIYKVDVVDAGGASSTTTCTVDRKSGAATLKSAD